MSSSDQPSPPHDSAPAPADARMQELRDILLREDKAYLTHTVQEVLAEATAGRVDASKDEMAEALAPVLGQAIRLQIKESQGDIIDALYPIIGKAIQRAVTEAMRSLAQRVDQGLRSTFSIKRLVRRIRARVQGIPESELLLREALPCRVEQVFLIHRASGLLLRHLSHDPAHESDTDLISSMLTAIQDFAQDTLGTEREGALDAIQYGSRSILVEPGPRAYLAAVIEGFEPEGFRHRMRVALCDVDRDYGTILEKHDGDASRLQRVEEHLRPLLATSPASAEMRPADRPPWLAIGVAGTVLLLCIGLACLGVWRVVRGRTAPTSQAPTETYRVVVSSTPTAAPPTPTQPASPTPTLTSTASPMPTHSPTPTPTASLTPANTPTRAPEPTATAAPTATFTPLPSPTPPYVGVMIGYVWLHAEPGVEASKTSTIVEQGRPVEVLAIYKDWYLIRWPPGDPDGSLGWVPGRWVGLFGAPPRGIITPEP